MSNSAYQSSFKDVLTNLKVRQDTGLSSREIAKRLKLHGKNVLPKSYKPKALLQLLDRFRDFLIWLLIVAGVVSILIGEVADAVIIGFIIAADILLSYVQVRRAEKTLQRLKTHVQQNALVVRGGSLKRVSADQLVPGDIIEFRAGFKIPADARLISAQGLRVREAALTGEANDVTKDPVAINRRVPLGDRRNMVYLGTTVMSGRGRAVVTSIGAKTEFGKIAQLIKKAPHRVTPLRRKLQRTGIKLSVVIGFLVAIIAGAQILQGESMLAASRTAITLIVSAIPEDLTIILTVALTIGVIRILRKQAVVRELSSAETLGSATVICTDKTGTLTEGEMKAVELDLMQGDVISRKVISKTNNDICDLAVTALSVANGGKRIGSGGEQYIGSATERALLAFSEAAGVDLEDVRARWKQIAVIPFDTHWKFRATLNEHPTQGFNNLFVIGAPEELISRSSQAIDESRAVVDITDTRRHELQKQVVARASQGQRLVGVAIKRHLEIKSVRQDDVQGLTWLGLVAIADPVREEVKPAILAAVNSGVEVKIITGDHAVTARAIAREVGIVTPEEMVVSGEEVEDMSDEELKERVEEVKIFARVGPLDKQRIVKALKKNGHVVAMTGDGVNDAVALKEADIGVAMGSGKDVARDAADLVLLNDSFATIVEAIREGRVIRDNIRKVVAFLLATNVAEVTIFLLSLVARMPLPLIPAQILWINLVTDGTSDMALALEPAESNVMNRGPEKSSANLLSTNLSLQIAFVGLAMTLVGFSLYWYLKNYLGMELDYVRTMIFTFISITSLVSTWSFRSLHESIFKRGIFQNKWLFVSGGFSLGLHLLAVYLPSLQSFFGTVPLNIIDWALLTVLTLFTLILMDTRKMFFNVTEGKN